MRLELVSREGCHLCEVAADLLRNEGLIAEVRDVDHDSDLLERYDLRVPVLMADGKVVAEGRISPESVRALRSLA